jgi:hypothetical protein
MKKISILLVLLILAATTMGVYGSGANVTEGIKVIVDGKEVGFPDTQPYINDDGRTMVPIRFISEKLGATVDWKTEKSNIVVTINKGTKTVILVTGEKKAKVDGETITFDTQAVNINGRTMVPLRFVSEAFGAQVDWNAQKKIVTITTEFSGVPSTGLQQGKVYPVKEVLTDISGLPTDLYDVETIKIVAGDPYQLEYAEKGLYKAVRTMNMKGSMYGVIDKKVVEVLNGGNLSGKGEDFKTVSSKERLKEFDHFLIVRVSGTEAELIENTLK